MEQLLNFLNSPVGGAVVIILISAIFRGMPKPGPNSFWYSWLYQTGQIILANFDLAGLAKARRVDPDKQQVFSFK